MDKVSAVRITELSLTGFRNLHDVRILPAGRINVLLGANGAGKTSVLEAIDYVASLSSFRGAIRSEIIGHQVAEARLRMLVSTGGLTHEYRVELDRSTRRILLDGKRPERAVDYYGNAACVVFQPGDLELVRGSPEMRRKLLDRVLIRVAPGYGEALKSYGKALRARNRILKGPRPDRRALGVYNQLLAEDGTLIVGSREEAAQEIEAACCRSIDSLGMGSEDISVSYRTSATGQQDAYLKRMEESFPMDLARGMTRVGPHGDDLVLRWKGRSARVVASQGQARTLALALRLAELEVLRRRAGVQPMLLLDDVTSELDRDRTRRLFEVVESLDTQVWVTTADPVDVGQMQGRRRFLVQSGSLVEADVYDG